MVPIVSKKSKFVRYPKNIKFEQKVIEEIDEIAYIRDTTFSEIIRVAVYEFLEKNKEKPAEGAVPIF